MAISGRDMSKECKCEHWQQCPVCMPHRFDKNGHLLPPEPTLLQAARIRIEELERDLLNLVCRIHRDGGHYIAKYGEAKAIADADTVAAQNNADLDALQADNAELEAALKPFGAIDLVESRLPTEFAMLILRARAAIAKVSKQND